MLAEIADFQGARLLFLFSSLEASYWTVFFSQMSANENFASICPIIPKFGEFFSPNGVLAEIAEF